MIPIHSVMKDPITGAPVYPADRLCYLLGARGVFRQIENEFYRARIQVHGIAHLADVTETAVLSVSPLPLNLFRQVEAFFVAVFHEHHSEAVVLLQYAPPRSEWKIEVPPQQVRGLHVAYDLRALPEPIDGFQRFGTIHSHAQIKAFHSGTDDQDEIGFDGLHITVGNVDQLIRSYSARWMISGKAFPVDMGKVLQDAALPVVEPGWLEQVNGASSHWFDEPPRAKNPKPSRTAPHDILAPEHWLDAQLDEFESPEDYLNYMEAMQDDLENRIQACRAELRDRELEKELSQCSSP